MEAANCPRCARQPLHPPNGSSAEVERPRAPDCEMCFLGTQGRGVCLAQRWEGQLVCGKAPLGIVFLELDNFEHDGGTA